MKKRYAWCLFALVMLAALCARSEVKEGENVLLNGCFETDQTEFPLYWAVSGHKEMVVWKPSDGPGGRPCLAFRNPQARRGEVTVRQFGLTLVSNALYRASLMVRTRDFVSKNHGAAAINRGWTWEGGLKDFPRTADWTRLTRDFRAKRSFDGRYSVAVYAIDFSGELDVADFRLEALDEAARAGTQPSNADEASRKPRVFPWGTDLRAISRTTRAAAFRFYGKLPAAPCELQITADGKGVRIPIPAARTTLNVTLPDGIPPHGVLTAQVKEVSGSVPCTETFAYRIADAVPTAGHRRLNNLVTEVLAARGNGTYTFTTTHDGWVFASVAAREAWLDGICVIDSETPRGETFRHIPYGTHTLVVKGAEESAPVVVRRIAEIFNYCPGVNSMVSENPPYDWEFQKKHAHCAVTTQNGGSVPAAHRDEFRSRGYRWLANLGTTKLTDENDLARRLAGGSGLTAPEYDGCTCDEQFFGQAQMIDWYTRGLKTFANPNNRLIYTWIVGKPGTPGVDHEFLSACREASGGRGRILFEAYCRTKATEAEARAYLETYVTDTLQQYQAWCPGVESATGIIFGNFTQIPILSLVHHPEVDYKYYLDLQLHLIATDPAFANLGCTGYWGSYYADHEIHRWSFALLRHYCVDGSQEMLSAKYGYRYLPGHLVNGDFRGSTEGWTVHGNVTTGEHGGFGSGGQNRWGGNGTLGDTFAVFSRTNDSVDSVRQTLKGLVPGRKYCLQFASFDVRDVQANRIAPRAFGITATLGAAAETDAAHTWRHVDKRIKGRYAQNNGVARINLHHIVFTARAEEIPLEINDAAAAAGEKLGVNCVSVNPFFEN